MCGSACTTSASFILWRDRTSDFWGAHPLVLDLQPDCVVQEAGDIVAESPPGNSTARPPSDPATSYFNARPGLHLPLSPVPPPYGDGVTGFQGQHPTNTTPPEGQRPSARSHPSGQHAWGQTRSAFSSASGPVGKSRGPAISANGLPIRCPQFGGRRFEGEKTAAFLEDSVSQFLGHRIHEKRKGM